MALEIGDRWFLHFDRGFEDKPSDPDYDSYYKALLCCANGDGTLTPEEREWVIGYCAASGGSDQLVEELRRYPATDYIHVVMSKSAHVSNDGARCLVLDALRASAADGDLNAGELKVIRRMATQLNVSAHAVNRLEQLYAEEQALREKRVNLLFPDGNPYSE
jgi:uncharacterized tellurite resistance protein B-like protein